MFLFHTQNKHEESIIVLELFQYVADGVFELGFVLWPVDHGGPLSHCAGDFFNVFFKK